jgi:hypothetical protein
MGSNAVIETLSKDIGIACEALDGTNGLAVELPPEQQAIFAKNKSAFTAALGVARSFTVVTEAPKAPVAKPLSATQQASPPPPAAS